MTTRKIEDTGATEVRNNDIVYHYGYRCRVSNCMDHIDNGTPVRTFVLWSEPDALNTQVMPVGFNGGRYGGSVGARYGREVTPHNPAEGHAKLA